MQKRRLGRSDLQIAPLMLGGNIFGWTADVPSAFAILDAFVDAGFNAIDTADGYSSWVPGHLGGESENVIGAWLGARGQRDRILLATKVGLRTKPHTRTEWDRDLSADYIVRSIEGSLRRLGTDYVDLYQAHTDDPATPLDETLSAFDRLTRSGKVRAIGGSHYDVKRLLQALDYSERLELPRFDSLQVRYNLLDRTELEGGLQAICQERDVGVLCYSALAKGFLTAKYRTEAESAESSWRDQLSPYLTAQGEQVLEALQGVAAEQNATPAQVALAWVAAQPGVAAPIAAVNSVTELDELLGSARLSLTTTQLASLAAAGAA